MCWGALPPAETSNIVDSVGQVEPCASSRRDRLSSQLIPQSLAWGQLGGSAICPQGWGLDHPGLSASSSVGGSGAPKPLWSSAQGALALGLPRQTSVRDRKQVSNWDLRKPKRPKGDQQPTCYWAFYISHIVTNYSHWRFGKTRRRCLLGMVRVCSWVSQSRKRFTGGRLDTGWAILLAK